MKTLGRFPGRSDVYVVPQWLWKTPYEKMVYLEVWTETCVVWLALDHVLSFLQGMTDCPLLPSDKRCLDHGIPCYGQSIPIKSQNTQIKLYHKFYWTNKNTICWMIFSSSHHECFSHYLWYKKITWWPSPSVILPESYGQRSSAVLSQNHSSDKKKKPFWSGSNSNSVWPLINPMKSFCSKSR